MPRTLSKLRNTFLPKLLSGELRIPDAQLPEGDACSLVELALYGLFPLPSPEQMVEIYRNFRRQRLAQLTPVGWQQMLGSDLHWMSDLMWMVLFWNNLLLC